MKRISEENRACCACLTVEYKPKDIGDCLQERWVCSDCGTEFIKKNRCSELKQENEKLKKYILNFYPQTDVTCIKCMPHGDFAIKGNLCLYHQIEKEQALKGI